MVNKTANIQVELDADSLYKIQCIANEYKISVDELIEKLIEEYMEQT